MDCKQESQYKKAITSGATSFFEVNLSKNLLNEDVILKLGDKEISASQILNFSIPCKASDFAKLWCEKVQGTVHISDDYNYEDYIQELINDYNSEIYAKTSEYWTTSCFGEKLYLREGIIITQNKDDDIVALIILRNMTKSRIEEENSRKLELEYYAYIDSVTGGDNYNKFKENLTALGKPGYLVSMDIHSFKIINSVCGVSKGDQVIQIVWNTLKTILTRNDLSGHINADKFVFYLSETDISKIENTLTKISLALNILSVDLDIPQLQPYFGVAYWTPEYRIEKTYNQAVAAKQKIKGRKDQNISFFDEADTDRLVSEKKMEDAFENALKNKCFEVWYQPKYNPETNVLVGAEALVRWRKDGELISPALFIPLFERNGMIRILDEYVFTTVCEQQRKWLDAGIDIVPVSINLSRASLYFKGVAAQYKWITEQTGIDTNYVPIEITESAAVSNKDIEAIADNFYKAGFPLHMDDFGSGYSSLASLNTMHFDTLKIDKSLIDFIGNYGGDRLLEHTIALAKELGLHVTAEGVESIAQVEFLQNLRCDSIQGFYFSRPLTVENFEKSLLVSSVIESFDKDKTIDDYIKSMRLPNESSTIYEFIVNLTNDKLLDIKGAMDWRNEVGLKEEIKSYTKEYTYLADNYILEEYRDSYKAFMNRDYLIKTSFGKNEIRSLEYERLYQGKPTKMRLTLHLFKMKNSEDLWMFLTVSNLTGRSLFDYLAMNFEGIDSLTSVYNRGYAMDLIKNKFDTSVDNRYLLVLTDIDNFKMINREFGYHFGDEVLIESAHRMRDFFPDAIVGRVGDDKFIIYHNIKDKSADETVRNFKEKVERIFYKKGKELKIKLNIGYSVFPEDSSRCKLDDIFSETDVNALTHIIKA